MTQAGLRAAATLGAAAAREGEVPSSFGRGLGSADQYNVAFRSAKVAAFAERKATNLDSCRPHAGCSLPREGVTMKYLRETRVYAGRMPLRLHLPMSPSQQPLVGHVSSMEYEAKSGECRREYMAKNRVRSPAAQAGSLAKPRRRTVQYEMRRIQRALHATNCQRNYMISTHAVAGSSPAIPTGVLYVDRDVAQLDRASFANPCRCVNCIRSDPHDECRWNYMTYGVAGSSPAVPIPRGRRA